MSERKKKNRKTGWIQVAALFFLLIVLPAGSWFYLKSGFDYRLSALEEMKDFGKIPDFQLQTHTQEPLTDQDVRDKVVIANFLTLGNPELRQRYGENLFKLHEQFDDRSDLVFLIHGLNNDSSATASDLARFATEFGILDEDQCFFLTGSFDEMQRLATEGYQLPLEEEGVALADSPFFALADTSSNIRNYYSVREQARLQKLVEHTAILLPAEEKKDIVFQREKEK